MQTLIPNVAVVYPAAPTEDEKARANHHAEKESIREQLEANSKRAVEVARQLSARPPSAIAPAPYQKRDPVPRRGTAPKAHARGAGVDPTEDEAARRRVEAEKSQRSRGI